ncbi:hypothetical protein EVAR_53875_1 [Eumeta japonica]|uniref:Uncharacterized protein n=1 Tax=Eumeta variegata TaxID=151549 RepID=A0A4C1XIL8_EUMVA|nr:hypothetical protein EVAR_53875_1 [Eumeta japonica]
MSQFSDSKSNSLAEGPRGSPTALFNLVEISFKSVPARAAPPRIKRAEARTLRTRKKSYQKGDFSPRLAPLIKQYLREFNENLLRGEIKEEKLESSN